MPQTSDPSPPDVPRRRPKGPMTESELKQVLWAKINNSIAYQGGRLAQYRMQALRYYNGDKFGNEVAGRSQVVSRDVAEAIDSMMPGLMRIFASTEDAVRFEARSPEKEAEAKTQTDYCNWVWSQQNDGFLNFYTWFKAALMDRLGVIKIWWDTKETRRQETYQGLTQSEFDLLNDDDNVQVEVLNEYPDPAVMEAIKAGMVSQQSGDTTQEGQQLQQAAEAAAQMVSSGQAPKLYDVRAVFTNKDGRIMIRPVPSDEFLVERRAVSLEFDLPFCAHRYKSTITDLVEMFPEKEEEIRALPTGEEAEYTMERLERFKQEDQLPWRQDNPADPSMREVWVTEAHVRVDYDGDGFGELRKVTVAGDLGYTILENIEDDDHPFAGLCPVPMPFKLFGISVPDQTFDIQLVKSTLLRGILDNMYNAISPQVTALENQVNLDDLLTRRPGGVVRVKSRGAVEALPNTMLGSEPYELIEYFDQVRQERTGVVPFNQNLDADALNKTATGARLIDQKTAERQELIARVFAETGVKRAFKRILELTCKYQQKKQIVRLNGKFVQIDPREWTTDVDVIPIVGLGTGNRDKQMMGLMQLLEADQQIIQVQGGINGPLVTAQNVYEKLSRVVQYLGYRSPEPFYTDPSKFQPPPQQKGPSPEQQAAMLDAQVASAAKQAEIESRERTAQADRESNERIQMAKLKQDFILGMRELQLNAAKVGIEADAVGDEQRGKQLTDAAEIASKAHSAEHDTRQHTAQQQNAQMGHQATMVGHAISAASAAHSAEKPIGAASATPKPKMPKKHKITFHRDEQGRIAGAEIEQVHPEVTDTLLTSPITPANGPNIPHAVA